MSFLFFFEFCFFFDFLKFLDFSCQFLLKTEKTSSGVFQGLLFRLVLLVKN